MSFSVIPPCFAQAVTQKMQKISNFLGNFFGKMFSVIKWATAAKLWSKKRQKSY